jgi:hypothetical protein
MRGKQDRGLHQLTQQEPRREVRSAPFSILVELQRESQITQSVSPHLWYGSWRIILKLR